MAFVFNRFVGVALVGAWLAATMVPGAAEAYMGPGSGLAAIGALLSLIGAGFMAVVGFVWFPIRRLIRRMSGSTRQREGDVTAPR
ncbi:hypothetical protein [Phenylobacterium sp.]|uniref:hypothetical protein n=1 Tax=Phenylobacterium sp. TaxID=1871053 RepID=UPI0035B26B28